MRILVATLLVGSASIAAADAPSETEPQPIGTQLILRDRAGGVDASAGGETVGRDANGALSVDSWLRYYEHSSSSVSKVEASAGATLRSGSTGTEAAANVDARLVIAHPGVLDRPILGGWVTAELGARPTLDARRDVQRALFADTGAGFQLGLAAKTGDLVRGLFHFDIGGTLQAQPGAKRATYSFDFDVYYRCNVANEARPRCLHILDTYSTGVSGKTQAVVTNAYFVRWTGLDLGGAYADIGIGGITNATKLSIDNTSDDKPPTTVQTEDLPPIQRLSWNAGIATQLGPVDLETRILRTGYVSLDGDMSIEDRATVTASMPLAAATKVSATAFAARTQWWTSKTDPGSHANTGGGELALDTRLHDFDVHAGAGVARSFYAVLDGAAADRPSLGFRSAIDVKHAIKNWVPRN